MSCVYFKCWLQIHTDQEIGPRFWFCRKQRRGPFKPKLAFGHETASSRYLCPEENTHQHRVGWEASPEWVWTVNDQIWDTGNLLYKYNPCSKPTTQNPLGYVNAASINAAKEWIHSFQVFSKITLKPQKSWNTNKVDWHCAVCFYLFYPFHSVPVPWEGKGPSHFTPHLARH